jgi:hypothetical protein
MSPDRDGAIGMPEECAVQSSRVSSAIPIRHTGFCWPLARVLGMRVLMSVVDTIILGIVWCGLGSVGSSSVHGAVIALVFERSAGCDRRAVEKR